MTLSFRDVKTIPMPEGDPTLIIEGDFWADIMARSQLLSIEVSGLGHIEYHAKQFFLRDLYRVKQKCSGSNTEVDDAALSRCLIESDQKYGCMPRFWWHSHANMGTFWSGTDEANKETYYTDWGISLVVNHSGQAKAELWVRHPIPHTLDLSIIVLPMEKGIDLDAIKKELEEDVDHSYVLYKGTSHGDFGSFQDWDDDWSWKRFYKPTSTDGLPARLPSHSEPKAREQDFRDYVDDSGPFVDIDCTDAQDAESVEEVTFGESENDSGARLAQAEGLDAFCDMCTDTPCGDRGGRDRWYKCPYIVKDGSRSNSGNGDLGSR